MTRRLDSELATQKYDTTTYSNDKIRPYYFYALPAHWTKKLWIELKIKLLKYWQWSMPPRVYFFLIKKNNT